jgi:hypothetical protein
MQAPRDKLRSKIQAMRHVRTGTLYREQQESKRSGGSPAHQVKKIEGMLAKLGMNAEMVKEFAIRAMRSGQVRDEASLMKLAEEFVMKSSSSSDAPSPSASAPEPHLAPAPEPQPVLPPPPHPPLSR